MNAVRLHEFFVQCDAFHEELDPRDLECGCDVAEYAVEHLDVTLAVVRRNLDTEQDDGRPGFRGRLDDVLEIAFHPGRRNTAQAVIATQCQDNQVRAESLDGRADPRRAAFGRIAADTGVDHTMFVPLLPQAGLQQSGPGLVHLYAEAGTQAVTEHQDGWRRGRAVCTGGQEQESYCENSTHGQHDK